MADTQNGSRLPRFIKRFTFLRSGTWFILFWPALGLIAAGLLWQLTISKIESDKQAISNVAFRDTLAIAQHYALHLSRAIEQVDQIAQFIEYEWRQEDGRLKLEELLKISIVPPSLLNFVALIDRDGNPVTATIPLSALRHSVIRKNVEYHRAENSQDIRIGTPTKDQISGKSVIHFTRRLQQQDGSFGGVVMVSIETGMLSAFYGGANLGEYGLLALLGQDGIVRMEKMGSTSNSEAAPALRDVPVLATPRGTDLFDGSHWFTDGKNRFVAWQALPGYPLVVLAGLAEEEILKPHLAVFHNYRRGALAGSMFFLLFALTGMALSLRLAWRKHQAEEIRNSYRLATESGEEGFFRVGAITDPRNSRDIVDFVVEDCNEHGAVFFGLKKQQLIGARFSELFSEKERNATMKIYRDAMKTGFHDGDFAVEPGSIFKASWLHCRLIRSGSGLAVTLRDISHTKAHERELLRLANEDALTNLPNRHWLMKTLPHALERAEQHGSMLALLFMDLNRFKSINDSYGHAVGDELLHAVALRLKSALRPSDNVVRLGGDEFVVILEPIVSRENAEEVAERIADAFVEPFKLSPGEKAVSASIGISLFPDHGDHADALLRNADMAMYASKSFHGKRYFFYEAELDRKLTAQREKEQALIEAVELDQFILYYQPRVDTQTCELRSMEALVRWIHPRHGVLEPPEFIVVAENIGLMVKLGELIIQKACAQIAQWEAQQLPVVPVSINVSAQQFSRGNVRQGCVEALARHGVAPTLMELEITESSMLGVQREIDAQLTALRASGIKLLIDDFGTGYSSLAQLQRLDMDILKIDQAFTAELDKTPEGEVFFKAIVSMAHALGMSVVAEGVETRSQMERLRMLACDQMQGFLISRPVPADEMAVLMRKQSLQPAL
jgi:diguanylate cyclase (GGDEF)-like protein